MRALSEMKIEYTKSRDKVQGNETIIKLMVFQLPTMGASKKHYTCVHFWWDSFMRKSLKIKNVVKYNKTLIF